MKKKHFVIIILCATMFQISFGQTNTKHPYASEVIEDLKKLDFNWTLPRPYQAEMNQGISALNNGDWKSGLDSFDKLIEFDSTFVPAYYFKISCYEIGRKISSDKAFRNQGIFYEKLANETREIYTDLWDIFVSNKDTRRITSLFGGYFYTHKKYTTKNNGKFAMAPPFSRLSRHLVEHQHEINDESFDHMKRAFSFLVIAKPKEAITQSNKSIELESSTCALYLKAIANKLLLQHDSAYYLFNELVKKDGQVIEAHENLALYENQLNDRVGVVKRLTLLNNIAPDSPEIWRFSGLMKVQINDYFGSIIDLTKYLNIDSTDFDCLKQRAIAEYNVKDYKGSLRDLNSAHRLTDRDLDIFMYKSENYLHMGDSINSIKVLRDAKVIFSFNQDLDLFTANKLVEINKPGQAQGIIDRVMRVILRNNYNQYLHQANLIQCKIYLKKGSTDKALTQLNSLIDDEGEYIDYLFLRSEIYLKKGDKVKAKADLFKLVKEGFRPAVDLYNSL